MGPGTLAVVALALCAFGVVSQRAERSPLTPPLFFVATGLVLGPAGLGFLDVELEGGALHLLAELTLVLVLFTDASRIDLRCLRREESLPLRLLGVGLPLTIAAGALVAVLLFPALSMPEALLVAAVLAPTDAALGQAVVSNERVPLRIRQTLNVESGLNDGIALPVVLMLASLAGVSGEMRGAAGWLQLALLAVTLGPAVGFGVGWLGGRVLERALDAEWINGPFQRLSAVGLALLAFACAELVGGNGFIAAFVAGATLGNTAPRICGRLYDFAEAEGQLLTLLVFLAFGALMVPEVWPHAGPAVLLYALASLTVIRMLPVTLSLLGSGLKPASIGFLGWFGPRGLASILFLLLLVEQGDLANGPVLEAVVVLTVLGSVVLHGITAYPLAERYAAFAEAHEGAEAERAGAMENPVRVRHEG